MQFGIFSALSAAFYLGVAWYFSYLSGFVPGGNIFFIGLLGILVLLGAVRISGFVLPLAGFLAGIAVYVAMAQPLSACIDSPTAAAGLGVPTCGALALTAVEAAAVVGLIAIGAGAFLLRVSRAPRPEKPWVALGTVMVAVLVASCAFVVMSPPPAPYPSNLGPELLPFPLPAGSTFLLPFPYHDPVANYTYHSSQPQAFAPVSAAGLAPALLIGAWDATVDVCIYVQGFSYGGSVPVALPFLLTCGTSVSFRFPVTPAVWQIAFFTHDTMVYDARVTITQTIQVVY